MAESMTKVSRKSVRTFLGAVEGDERRKDAQIFLEMMKRVTGAEPKMWGDSIVGFGKYHYKYESGHEGDTCLAGFSPRKNEFSLYLTGSYFPETEGKTAKLREKLGKHRMGKACLYVKKASDIDLEVLEQLLQVSVDALRKHYPAD